MSNLVHNEQVKLAATFWNNLGVAALLGVFLVPALYTRHTILQQALSIGVGLLAAIGLRMVSHWSLRRLRDRTGLQDSSLPELPFEISEPSFRG
jgi:hypothetical protein